MVSVGPLTIVGNKASFLVDTDKPHVVNMLRRAILTEVETYCIEYVTIYRNTSALYDEVLAFLFGQLVIDNERYPHGDNFTFHFDSKRGGERLDITTDDLVELPFLYKTPITILPAGGHIVADLTVRKGTGRMHCKWRPVSTCMISEEENKYRITFHTIGMLSADSIVRQALANLPRAYEYPPQTIFSRPVTGDNL